MEEKKNKLFRKESLDRVSSPEQLNDYIKVSNPGVWIVLAAFLILLAGVFVWACTYDLKTTVTIYGIKSESGLICLVSQDAAEGLKEGLSATVEGSDSGCKIAGVSDTPLSYEEAAELARSDYAAYAMGLSEWNLKISLSCPDALEEGKVYRVSVTLDSIRPISFLFD